MVERRLTLEPEVQQIFELIDGGQNFLLSGGAGSGKTYSLVHVIEQAIFENPSAKIACMTYTFAAVKEIQNRINHSNLFVSTFHEFLWSVIKHYQKEIKRELIRLINDPEHTRFEVRGEENIENDFFDSIDKGIQYREFLRLRDGVISHDELLIIASAMFERYPMLSGILKDKFKFIFIDEYQDTDPSVVDIFLTHFEKSNKPCTVGFFGDSMQSIYDNTISNLDSYIAAGKVVEVQKKQNRRNPQKIITLANRLRTDGLEQVPSEDATAPNMENENVKDGNVFFIHSNTPSVENAREFLTANHAWDFTASESTKELNLTHNLIADKAGFRSLMNIYNSDKIIAYRDRVKKYIRDGLIETDFSEMTFGEVIGFLKKDKTAKELKKIEPTKSMLPFIEEHKALYDVALNTNFLLFSKMYVNKDQLLDDKKNAVTDLGKRESKRDALIKHLCKLQDNIRLYTSGDFNEFLRKTDFKPHLKSIAKKKELRDKIESLLIVGDKKIGQVIQEAHDFGICEIDDYLTRFIENKKYVYDQVAEIPYSEFQRVYHYLEGFTPFSTKHKTKGAEFDHVLVILDNGNWRNYDFENLFLKEKDNPALVRSQKIFYVCCTRAKDSLAIFYHSPSAAVLAKATEWFGEENIVPL